MHAPFYFVLQWTLNSACLWFHYFMFGSFLHNFSFFFFLHVIGIRTVGGPSVAVTYQPAQFRVVKRPMLPATAYAQDLISPDMLDASHVQHHHQTSGAYSVVRGINRNSSNSKRSATSGRTSEQESHNSSSSTSVSSIILSTSSNTLSTSSTSQPPTSLSAHNSPYAQINNSNSSRSNKTSSYLPGML